MRGLIITYLLFFFIGQCTSVLAQDDHIAELKKKLKTELHDTSRVLIYSELANIINEEDEWTYYNDLAYKLADEKLEGSKGKEREVYLSIKADATANKGFYYSDHGNLPKALELYFEALEIYDEAGIEEGKSPTLGNIGIILSDQGDFEEALDYHTESLELKKKYDPENVAVNYINIGAVYEGMKKSAEALEAYNLAYEAASKIDDFESMATAINNIGSVYYHGREYRKAIGYMFSALELYKKSDSPSGVGWALANIGQNYLELKMIDSALYYNLYAKKYADSLNYPRLTANVSGNLAKLYEQTGDWENAFKQYHLFISMEDSMQNVDVQKEALKQKLEYDHNLETMEISMKAEAEKKRSEQAIYFILGGLGMVIIFAFVIYSRLRVTRKQKNTIEGQNKEILDSINYAKRLQNAILPKQEEVVNTFNDAFILYLPKDIVAGDFYWMHRKGDLIFIAAADCTGHGVPGAMVSVVCANALERAVFEFGIENTGLLLDKVRELVVETFEKSGEDVKDGMDISLCRINLKTGKGGFTGANNPLWIKRKSSVDMEILKGSRQPVGKAEHNTSFEEIQIELKEGDWVYMFSDGFADQFGGADGKKFKSLNLKKLLLNNSEKTGLEQYNNLVDAFTEWTRGYEQLDDVCVIGWQF